jgi:GTPase-associated protein 1, N-terminal domain type 2/GTPase-associated protein 1, middle domain
MSVLQYYYTSFVHPQTNSAGFQVKAMSPDISPDNQALIARLIAYHIPPTLDERAIQSHPIALRYYYKSRRECILLCSQSSGNDESGRPGNFFAHTLILEPEMFKTIPPVFFWQSAFWLKKDAEARSQVDILPVLPAFEEVPSLDIERVWSFLASTAGNDYFHKLMSAIVHCHKTLRRVVIVDTADHVALWIAAVSCLLPPEYRPLLSFATYHHDPRQGQFMITGTTSDSSFRNSAEEYFAYFVLNAETGTVSDVEPSAYANLVASVTSSGQYESQILPFFALTIRRFPHLMQKGEQQELAEYFELLDMFALYFALLENQATRLLSAEELHVVGIALSGFEQLQTYDEEDIIDLQALRSALEPARPLEVANPQFDQLYRRLEKLLKTASSFFA